MNLFVLFSFQGTNNYENATAKPPDSQQGAQLALSNWYLHLKTDWNTSARMLCQNDFHRPESTLRCFHLGNSGN